MLRVLLWTLLAWPLPALVAGALGWRGIWGSGSATPDYLIPLPVAGGALHVPSFALAALALGLAPKLKATEMRRARLLALGAAIAGALMLFEWPGGRLQQNPLGLFLLSDGALAFVALNLFRQARPQPARWRPDLISLGLLVAPAALLALVVWRMSPAARDFSAGHAALDERHARSTIFVFTPFKPESRGFRDAAAAWADQNQHPSQWGNVEEVALLFVREHAASLSGDRGAVFATLCQYEDGTPPRWLDGAGDCFAGRVTFTEQIARATAAQPAQLPPDLRRYLGRIAACQAAPPPPPPRKWIAITRNDECESLAAQRASMASRYPGQVP